jgi:hypothetical protein
MKRIQGFKHNKKEKIWLYGDPENGIRITTDGKYFMGSCSVNGEFYGPFGHWESLEDAIENMYKHYNAFEDIYLVNKNREFEERCLNRQVRK